MKAVVQIPTLLPGKNFFMPPNYDWYQITAEFGVVPDYLFDEPKYKPAKGFERSDKIHGKTDWFPAKKGSREVALELQLPAVTGTGFSLLVAAGISFGKATDVDRIEAIRYVGAAKIIGMK
jgi:hypothetical protein